MHYLSILFVLLLTGAGVKNDATPVAHHAAAAAPDQTHQLYTDCHLSGLIPYDAFSKCMAGYDKYKPAKHIVAICDFTRASNEKRFVVVDLDKKQVVSNTFVAHGKNSGDLMATSFSNVMESHKSSKGFFRIGEQIQTALHGPSLLLDGLEKGINDNARAREIIIHGAWYAAESFIHQYGYCGKSFGCPALPETAMKKLLPILANGALLYIYAK
ncbi:MAG: murein L,D-transpeptidase catalytic domain family protein [Bacteroidetes bacterium]|nr:murein L,D-transpeptidase catalytic domain family protein [Bacteroidota bacterium]MBS1686985.1 murein L,D-transpeptidase catalytic domain family protein [Bacteroidota bacterium]